MKTPQVIFTLLCCSQINLADATGFAPYQIIIDKHPFGEDPPDASETTLISAEESFAKDLRLSMLFQNASGGVRVGFVDASKNNKSFILNVGESINGIELVEADLETSEALLKKGSEVALFKLKADTSPEILSKTAQTSRASSYAERRKAQQAKAAEQQPAEPAQPQLTGEALKKHLEEVQMDAIRNGLPPLPLPLTPEMDRQLVEEGVLDRQ